MEEKEGGGEKKEGVSTLEVIRHCARSAYYNGGKPCLF